jgi:hypothetical protein
MWSRISMPILVAVVVLSTIALIIALANDEYAMMASLPASTIILITVGGYWAVMVWRKQSPARDLPGIFLWILAVSGLCYFGTMGCSDPNQIWWELSCRGNLQRISVALHNYHTKYGSFPPAYIADETGRPKHSWRVLILPFLEQEDLYHIYSFDEPWDGPTNKLLFNKEPCEYICPADEYAGRHRNQPTGRTGYVAIVGPKAPWKGKESAKYADFYHDGTSNTILVIEVANSDIQWSEPRDFEWDNIRYSLEKPEIIGISSKHWMPGGFFWKDHYAHHTPCLLGDGTTKSFPTQNLTPELLEKTFTVGSGGYNEQDFDGGTRPGPDWNYWNCAVLVIWIASVFLLLCRMGRANRQAILHAP